MVTITQKEETKEEMDEARQRAVKKRTILVMARLHPGESPASYVVQGNIEIIVVNGVSYFYFFFFSGLMDFLVSKHKIAVELRAKLIFKVLTFLCATTFHIYIEGDPDDESRRRVSW